MRAKVFLTFLFFRNLNKVVVWISIDEFILFCVVCGNSTIIVKRDGSGTCRQGRIEGQAVLWRSETNWCARPGSNRQPSAPEADALSS